jgi:hypothetical protein
MEEQVNVTSGVDSVPAAGEQAKEESGFDLDALLFGNDSESGAKEEGAADPDEGAEQGEGEVREEQIQDLPDDASKAFATKWKEESGKLEEKIRAKILAEMEEKTRTTGAEQAQGAPPNREITPEELEKLADDLKTSPEVAKILYKQQQLINQQTEDSRRNAQRSREQSEYNSAVQYARQLHTENPSLPDWNDDTVHEYRMNHYKTYGTTLPWKEAYRMQLADAVLKGDISRQAQQEVIRKIQERDTASVDVKSPESRKSTIADLSDEQFAKLKEEVKLGKHRRS